MLADKLNMSPKEAERWIVNLIRQAKLDAKIDSQQGHVVMGTQAVSPYQQLIEKTKTLSFRTQMLSINVEKKATARYSEVGVTAGSYGKGLNLLEFIILNTFFRSIACWDFLFSTFLAFPFSFLFFFSFFTFPFEVPSCYTMYTLKKK